MSSSSPQLTEKLNEISSCRPYRWICFWSSSDALALRWLAASLAGIAAPRLFHRLLKGTFTPQPYCIAPPSVIFSPFVSCFWPFSGSCLATPLTSSLKPRSALIHVRKQCFAGQTPILGGRKNANHGNYAVQNIEQVWYHVFTRYQTSLVLLHLPTLS